MSQQLPDDEPDRKPKRAPSVWTRLVLDQQVSHGAFRLWHYLADKAGRKGVCWPCQRTIAEDLGCKRNSLKGWTQELVTGGYITTGTAGRNHFTVYRVLRDAQTDNTKGSRGTQKGAAKNSSWYPSGTVVVPKGDRRGTQKGTLTDSMNRGKEPKTTPQEQGTQQPSAAADEQGSLGAAAPVFALEREPERNGKASPQQQLEALWGQAFEAKFKLPYDFEGGKDGRAVKTLLTRGKPQDVVAVARQAWDRTGYPFDQGNTLSGLASGWNHIRAQLAKVAAGQTASSVPGWRERRKIEMEIQRLSHEANYQSGEERERTLQQIDTLKAQKGTVKP